MVIKTVSFLLACLVPVQVVENRDTHHRRRVKFLLPDNYAVSHYWVGGARRSIMPGA